MEKMQRRRFKKTYKTFTINSADRLWLTAFNFFANDEFRKCIFRFYGIFVSPNNLCVFWICEWTCFRETLHTLPWVKLVVNYNNSVSFLSSFHILCNDCYEFCRWRLLSETFRWAAFINNIILLTIFG